MSHPHDVCITGYGLLSSLPEDNQQLWQALNQFSQTPSTINTTDFSPYIYHPLTEYDVEQQIVKPSDRRLMGKTMQTAVYTAGLALDRAQLKNNVDLLKDTHIIVALRGGERDEQADQAIIDACHVENEYQEILNKNLLAQLRPTLFLSQLPNLLASNIAVLFGLTGSSLTLMGGEIAGAQAVKLAISRIQSGQAERVLVGGVSINESNEIISVFAQSQKLLKSPYKPLWQRENNEICLGSASGFLILESQASVAKRNANVFAKISQCEIKTDKNKLVPEHGNTLTMSHSSEDIFANPNNIRGIASAVGTILEAAMPVGIILALQCLQHKTLFAPLEITSAEKPHDAQDDLKQIWVHCKGQNFGHAVTCLEVV